MNIHTKYQPQDLSEIVGQSPVNRLRELAKDPFPSCWMLEGEPGTGKTTSALAFAAELGCHDEFSGLWTVECGDWGVDDAKELFGRTLRLRFGSSSGFNVAVLEELDYLSPQCQRYLKTALDPMGTMPQNLIVVATSNDATKLERALLQRFHLLAFSSGKYFQQACLDRLQTIWHCETGQVNLPPTAKLWGDDGQGFSMRVALNHLSDAANREHRKSQ
tara:strand:- start:628 stop:1281 length:654 start_codon:yes stop_codon:yes gene_type:complete